MKKLILLSTFLFCSGAIAESLTLNCQATVIPKTIFGPQKRQVISFVVFFSDTSECSFKNCNSTGWIEIASNWHKPDEMPLQKFPFKNMSITKTTLNFEYSKKGPNPLIKIDRLTGKVSNVSGFTNLDGMCVVGNKVPDKLF